MKVFILYQILYGPLQSSWTRYQTAKHPPAPGPFAAGVYDVRSYVVNRDTIPLTSTDSLRWRDVIIDSNAAGSVGSRDPVFWQRYRRGYFRYKADTASQHGGGVEDVDHSGRQHVPVHHAVRGARLEHLAIHRADPRRHGAGGSRPRSAPLPVGGAPVPLAVGVQPVGTSRIKGSEPLKRVDQGL